MVNTNYKEMQLANVAGTALFLSNVPEDILAEDVFSDAMRYKTGLVKHISQVGETLESYISEAPEESRAALREYNLNSDTLDFFVDAEKRNGSLKSIIYS